LKISIHDYGGYAFTLQLAQALAAHGHQVSYLYSETTQLVRRLDPAGSNGRLAIHGVSLARPFRKYSFWQRRVAEHEHGGKVVEMILEERPEVVISANAPLDAQAGLLAASRKIGARFVFWFQDAVGLATRRLLRGKLPLLGEGVGLYYEALERRLARLSDHIILISEDFLSLMEAWGVSRCKVATIPNWAPLDETPPMPKDNPWAREHGLADRFVFLYAGILGLKHDPGRLVELARALAGQAKVVVVSEGGGAEWLADQVTRLNLNNLLLLPFQPKDDLPHMFGAADVLVSILNNEAGTFSVPSKVLSYLCAQRPLLLSLPVDNQAARLVCQAQAGLVACPEDREAWVAAARCLLQDESLRKEMGANGRAYAETHFDIHKIAGQFLNVLLP
jgi:colanic acid biosynthesis glycosyl transferase WcaI